jgi:hypothetical protein
VLKPWNDRELSRHQALRDRRMKEGEEDMKRAAAERKAALNAETKMARLAFEEASRNAREINGNGAMPIGLTPDEFLKGVELLLEFPPKEGWGSASDKTADWLRVKFPVIGAMLTPAEQKYLKNYDLWLKVKEYVDQRVGGMWISTGAGVPSPDTSWLMENRPPELPPESPPAAMLPSAWVK